MRLYKWNGFKNIAERHLKYLLRKLPKRLPTSWSKKKKKMLISRKCCRINCKNILFQKSPLVVNFVTISRVVRFIQEWADREKWGRWLSRNGNGCYQSRTVQPRHRACWNWKQINLRQEIHGGRHILRRSKQPSSSGIWAGGFSTLSKCRNKGFSLKKSPQ